MKKPIILVTGAEGQLGCEIKVLSKHEPEYNFIFIDKKEVDLTNERDFLSFTDKYNFKYLINCAAYTAVDLAENEKELAREVNESVPEMLARFCKSKGVRLIHISTDYVFDGSGNRPITESIAPNPISVYGKTKLNREKRAIEIDNYAYVIRTSWVYSSHGKNFVKTMLTLGKQRDELNVVYDQIGSPTNATDLAEVIITIIKKIENGIDNPGIYHYSNEGAVSWFDFAVEIMRLANLKCKINPILTYEYPTAAQRPVFSVLDKSKIKKAFDIKIPHWTKSLEKTIKELK